MPLNPVNYGRVVRVLRVDTNIMPGLTIDRFIFSFNFFIADFSYAGFVPLGDFVDMLGNN
jgi:hypothetical protein